VGRAKKNFHRRFGEDMLKRGFVMRENFIDHKTKRRSHLIFSWESMVKAYFAQRQIRNDPKRKTKRRERKQRRLLAGEASTGENN